MHHSPAQLHDYNLNEILRDSWSYCWFWFIVTSFITKGLHLWNYETFNFFPTVLFSKPNSFPTADICSAWWNLELLQGKVIYTEYTLKVPSVPFTYYKLLIGRKRTKTSYKRHLLPNFFRSKFIRRDLILYLHGIIL